MKTIQNLTGDTAPSPHWRSFRSPSLFTIIIIITDNNRVACQANHKFISTDSVIFNENLLAARTSNVAAKYPILKYRTWITVRVLVWTIFHGFDKDVARGEKRFAVAFWPWIRILWKSWTFVQVVSGASLIRRLRIKWIVYQLKKSSNFSVHPFFGSDKEPPTKKIGGNKTKRGYFLLGLLDVFLLSGPVVNH